MPPELTRKKIYKVFIPAILLCALALFIQIVRYEPLIPKMDEQKKDEQSSKFIIPILPTDPIIGNKKSPVTVVAFEDFSCGGCKAQHELFLELQNQYPDKVKMVWKGLPVNDFPYPSSDALKYGICAHEQKKFDEFASYAYANATNLSPGTLSQIADEIQLDRSDLDSCLSSERPAKQIELTKEIARTLNLQSVPTFFINNTQIQTPQSLDAWKQILGL